MSKSAKSNAVKKAAETGQLWLRLPGLVREALYETVIGAGLACVDEVLEGERTMLCGARYQHLSPRRRCAPDMSPVRWCWADGGWQSLDRGRAAWTVMN